MAQGISLMPMLRVSGMENVIVLLGFYLRIKLLRETKKFIVPTISIFTSPGSILADMAVTLVNHPDAESVFFARLDSLLDSLFPGGALLQGTPGISKTQKIYPR